MLLLLDKLHTSLSSKKACRHSSKVGNVLVEYVSLYTSVFFPPGAHFQSPSRAFVPPISPVMMVCVYSRTQASRNSRHSSSYEASKHVSCLFGPYSSFQIPNTPQDSPPCPPELLLTQSQIFCSCLCELTRIDDLLQSISL